MNDPTSHQPLQSETSASEVELGFVRRHPLLSPREALQPEAAPPPPPPEPPRGGRGFLSLLSGFLTFLLVLSLGSVIMVVLGQNQMRQAGPLPSDKIVYIAQGTDVPDIISLLDQQGVIGEPLLFNLSLLLEGNRSRVKAGEYMFHKGVSMREVVDILVAGKQLLHSVTIPEGLTSEQIVQRLRDNDLLTGDIRDIPKEGSLLPETYKVPRGMARSDLIRKMQDEQKKVLDQVWMHRSADPNIRTPFDMLILASIVEKETGHADERPRVAAVFLNRLARGMRLQSDPTIVYGLVGGKATLGRGILKSEVEQKTPYNTYAIDGLPPGPISNPGRAALEAVATPSRSKELYFVADGTGGHVFAESLEQHARNVAHWRQIEHDRGTASSTPSLISPAQAAPDGNAEGGVDRAPVDVPQSPPDLGLRGSGPRGEAEPALPPAQSGAANPKPTAKAAVAMPKLDPRFSKSLKPETSRLDGPVDSDGDGDGDGVNMFSYPVPQGMRAQQQQEAGKLGLPQSSSSLPDDAMPRAAPAQANPPTASGRPVILDASEGTALDPLKAKNWDLNSAKTVPAQNATMGR
jgi:UPF0755 protein